MAERTAEEERGRGYDHAGGELDTAEALAGETEGANPQEAYIRSLVQPAGQRARAAIDAAGLPIAHFIPSDAKSFEKKDDGSFTLDLGREVKIPLGDTTLVLTSKISGVLGSGTMTNVTGIYGSKKVLFVTAKANIHTMTVQGDELVVGTDNSMAKEIRISLADIKAVS